jgi:hypothetical protein
MAIQVNTVKTSLRPEAKRVSPWLLAATVPLAAFMELLDTTIVNVAVEHNRYERTNRGCVSTLAQAELTRVHSAFSRRRM